MKTENTASKHIEELKEMVSGGLFGDPKPISDFERKCQALRGWRIGDIALVKETEDVGFIKHVEPSGMIGVLSFSIMENADVRIKLFDPSELINLSRGE